MESPADLMRAAIVGLGTVMTEADLARAAALGLRFAFSPGAPDALLRAARSGKVPFVPGIQTATELMAAIEAGAWGAITARAARITTRLSPAPSR